jgi:hypothetical protein
VKTGDVFGVKKSLYVRRCGIGRIELRKRGRYGEDGLLHRCKGTEMFLLNGFSKITQRVE